MANNFEAVSNIKLENFRRFVYHVETPGYYNWLPWPGGSQVFYSGFVLVAR